MYKVELKKADDVVYEENYMYVKWVMQHYYRNMIMIKKNHMMNPMALQTMEHNGVAFCRLIDYALLICEPETELIIRNMFVTNRLQKEWYLEYFSKTTYYRKRKEAINEFANCLRNDEVAGFETIC